MADEPSRERPPAPGHPPLRLPPLRLPRLPPPEEGAVVDRTPQRPPQAAADREPPRPPSPTAVGPVPRPRHPSSRPSSDPSSRPPPRPLTASAEGPLQRPLIRPRDLVAREQAQRATNAERGDERVLAGLSRLRAEAAYEAAAACPACAEARTTADDADALCDDHLAHAMGLHSEWDAIRRR